MDKARATGRRLRTLLIAMLMMVSGCLSVHAPAPSVDPQGAPITTAQIQSASKETWRTVDAILLGLVGGAAGTFVGGVIGYHIDYPNDIQHGCEDCGLDGALTGALIGMVTGITVGGNAGLQLGAKADRADAIRRIIEQRTRAARVARALCGAPPRLACAALPASGIGGTDIQLGDHRPVR